ncbi:glucokinase [Inhella gelatinilytica]|uniref:Glucokinase n=1 Tax=Inhella gelatinilytica TaxID=2795030 RepID=A0A931NDT7_9BURK|nr:glucokinase [Inhella gelatinilytica]MBH9551781.1 glucokinase [Inhella gelatinilytica]
MSAPFDRPRLLADVGGTFARFALETAPGVLERAVSLRCADHDDFHAAVRAYLDALPQDVLPPQHAAVAIANPVEGDQVRMTNYHWEFSIEAMRQRLGLDTLVVVNDFTALAMALPRLGGEHRQAVGQGQAVPNSVVGLLGSGTGLGVSGLIPSGGGWVALGTEGGHTSFSPRDEREIAILRYAWREHAHVSFERLCSGAGMALIYRALADLHGITAPPRQAPEITQAALEDGDALALETLEVFCALLGTAAGNLAVTLGATGGIYIGGGIVPRLGAYFERSPFRQRFEERGRFSRYVAAIPTYVITAEDATFQGASAILEAQLKKLHGNADTLLAQVRRAKAQLTPAEQRVAEQVLARPRALLTDPIGEIARLAGVSQPTVIRFCRSLGSEGLSDFKLRLASSLTGTVPVTHTQVTVDDSMVELGSKVLGNTASAILQVRNQLNRDTIDRATDCLTRARRIECFGSGHYAVVAQDAQLKFLRVGVPASSHTEPRLQHLAARVLGPGDVALIVSPGGRLPELLDVADQARQRGAKVVAITAHQSPLARKADVALLVESAEDPSIQLPMVGRILHLLVIDILAVGLALRRGAQPEALDPLDEPEAQPVRARPTAPGVSLAGPIASLTTHSHER